MKKSSVWWETKKKICIKSLLNLFLEALPFTITKLKFILSFLLVTALNFIVEYWKRNHAWSSVIRKDNPRERQSGCTTKSK